MLKIKQMKFGGQRPPNWKIDRFRHEYASQLNLYMNFYIQLLSEDDIKQYLLENI